MKRRHIVIASMSAFALFASAQSAIEACRDIITVGLREYEISSDSAANLNTIFKENCETSGEVKSSSLGVGLDLVVKAIPISLTGNYSDSEQGMRSFCKTYSSFSASNSSSSSYSEKIVREAYSTFRDCIAIAQTGISLRQNIVGLEKVNFFVAPGFVRPVTVRGIDTSSKNIACVAQNPNVPRSGAKPFTIDSSIKIGADKTLSIVCTRTPVSNGNGEAVFEEGSVTLLTDIAPNGNYSVFLPRDARLQENQASVIAERLNVVEGRLNESLVIDQGNVSSQTNPTVSATITLTERAFVIFVARADTHLNTPGLERAGISIEAFINDAYCGYDRDYTASVSKINFFASTTCARILEPGTYTLEALRKDIPGSPSDFTEKDIGLFYTVMKAEL